MEVWGALATMACERRHKKYKNWATHTPPNPNYERAMTRLLANESITAMTKPHFFRVGVFAFDAGPCDPSLLGCLPLPFQHRRAGITDWPS